MPIHVSNKRQSVRCKASYCRCKRNRNCRRKCSINSPNDMLKSALHYWPYNIAGRKIAKYSKLTVYKRINCNRDVWNKRRLTQLQVPKNDWRPIIALKQQTTKIFLYRNTRGWSKCGWKGCMYSVEIIFYEYTYSWVKWMWLKRLYVHQGINTGIF